MTNSAHNFTSTHDENTALALPVDIEQICAERDASLTGWADLHAHFHTQLDALNAMSFGGPGLGVGYDQNVNAGIVPKFLAKSASDFAERLRLVVDRRCWHGLAEKVKARELMDRQANDEFHKGLAGDDVPEFTLANVTATFGALWADRRMLKLRGVANIFCALDRRFRSHNGFKIGARVVMNGALCTEHGVYWNSYRSEWRLALEDMEKALHDLGGAPLPDRRLSDEVIAAAREQGFPAVVESEYLRIRIFKNGNLHLWLACDEIHNELNHMLAEYYGEVIGDAYDTTEADEAPAYHVTPAKGFGAFFTSEKVANEIAGLYDIYEGATVLEPSAGGGALAKAARKHGAKVDCIEIQPGLAHELRTVHGFNTKEADFLTLTSRDLPQYDFVLMNPPFDRGRDCDHVRHAMQFVKPGGRLVAIMAARAEHGDDARHRAFHKAVNGWGPVFGRNQWRDLPPGSFAHAGTQVNTVILGIKRPLDS